MISKNHIRLRNAARQIREFTHNPDYPVHLKADVTEVEKVRDVFQTVMKREKRLDILVNNAGVGVFKPFLETTLDDYRKVFKVNVEGVFIYCQEAFRIMKAQRGGCIFNIGSVASLAEYPNQSVYSSSKHALLGLTKVLALEGREQNIKVLSICPGSVDTDMTRELSASIRPDLKPGIMMKPEDVANSILYMIGFSDKAIIDNIVIRRLDASPRF